MAQHALRRQSTASRLIRSLTHRTAAHAPFTVYAVATLTAMGYVTALICRAAG